MFDVLGGLGLDEKNEKSAVLRAILEFRYNVGTSGQHTYGAFGLIIAGDQAITAGSGSIPDPVSNGNAGWMHLAPFNTERLETQVYQYDVRVARRLPLGFSLAFKLQTDALAEGQLHWGVYMRVLLRHR